MRPIFNYIYSRLRIVLILAVAGTGLRGYAGSAETKCESSWPAKCALGRDLPDHRDEAIPERQTDETQHESGDVLTLLQALEMAALNSPELAASSHGVWAAEATERQAGAFPNPDIEVEAEDFGGTGSRKGYGAAQTTVRLTQSVELGGKRGKRQRVAGSEARLVGWDYEATRLDVLTITKKAFVDVLLAQGQLALAESLLLVAEDVRKAAAERVKAGKASRLEETKASVEVATARISRDRTRRELNTARTRLASAWGETTPVFKEAAGDLNLVMDVLPLSEFSALLENTPEVARLEEKATLTREALALEKSERIPDVAISAGISRLEEDGSHAAIVSFSLLLPLFDRNAGGILAATHQSTRAEYEQIAARLRATTELVDAHSRLESAKAETQAIKDELLPGAQQAFEAAQAGYREGKFSHLEVLDTQRTLSEARARHLDVLAAYHKAAADIERLTGIPLNTIQ